MTATHAHEEHRSASRSEHSPGLATRLESISFWLMTATLAWAPFPLGSNRPWSWSLLVILVCVCWLFWYGAAWNSRTRLRALRRLAVPLSLAGLTIAWALVQTSSWVPESWAHPIWPLAKDFLNRPLAGVVSMDPWRTVTEAMKLGTYVMAAVLAYMFALDRTRAHRLLDALLIVGTLYVVYTLALDFSNFRQESLFYASPPTGGRFGGPFVGQNSFATYAGLTTLCASVRLFELGEKTLVIGRGIRQFAVSAVYFVFGAGAFPAAAFVLSFAMLVASGSRAGFMACLVGIAAMMLFGSIIAGRRLTRTWAIIGVVAVAAVMIALFTVTGDNLQTRFDSLVQSRGLDQTRLLLWDAAYRMIGDAPWLGLGLGSFEYAYPLYAERVVPFVMDKAHNDYLEFAAGVGLPAAIAWWLAFLWLVGICIRGVIARHRNRHFPMLAIAATTLVGFHSLFDFSLQIPAIALTYAFILGLGVAQSMPTRERQIK